MHWSQFDAFRPALLGYLVDAPTVVIPTLIKAAERREIGKALASLPAFFVLRLFNSFCMSRAVFLEFVMKRTLLVYEKGH